MPNCARCSGKGGVCDKCGAAVFAGMDLCWSCHVAWKKNLTADGAEDADKTKEEKVQTFQIRLAEFKEQFPRLVAMSYDGRRVVLPDAQNELRNMFALQSACAGAADVTTVQRTLVWAVVCMCLRRKPAFFSGMEFANQQTVAQWLSPVLTLLAKKNASYGNTALAPIRCFAKARALDMLASRIDDKISRILAAQDAFGEDALADLAGYLVLYLFALEDEWDAAVRAGFYCPTHRMPWNRCGCQMPAKNEEYRDLDSSCGE